MSNYTIENAVYMRDGQEIEFKYYTDISMSKKVAFVDAVVNTVVGDDYYYSMMRDMIFDFNLINFFSDIDTGIDFSNDNSYELLNDIDEFLSDTNAADIIKVNVNMDVLIGLNDSVDKAIEYKTGIHPSPIVDALASLLNTVEKKFSGIDMDSMAGMANVFNKLHGDITPEKMLDAYAKSDIFKKQHENVVEAQKKHDVAMDKVREDAKDNVQPVVESKPKAKRARKSTKRVTASKSDDKVDDSKTDSLALV